MKVDESLVKNFTTKYGVTPTHATCHVQSDSAVAVHDSETAAKFDADERVKRAIAMGVKADYTVVPL
jgi:hypothetical protein